VIKLFNYGLLALGAGLIYLLVRFTGSNELTLSLVFLSSVVLPGFLLGQIFGLKLKDDLIGNVVVATALGFLLAFIISLLGIVIRLTINDLTTLYLTLIVGLFLIAFGLSLAKEQDLWLSWSKVKLFFQRQHPLLYLMLAVCLAALFAIGIIGGQFSYDSYFHLSIMRKVFDGQSLSLENLSFTKNVNIHIAYGVPVWHVFLSLIAKLAKTNIFNVWAQIPLALSILGLIVWYWLAKLILPGKMLAILAVICFIFAKFTFGGSEVGMFAMPEYFARTVLLPLMLALALRFIFEDRYNWKFYGLVVMLSLFTGMVHWIQYFYYLTVIGSFGILYIFLGPKKDKINFIKRIALVFFGSWPFIIGYILFLQIESGQSYSFLQSHTIPEAAFIHASYRYQWLYFSLLAIFTCIFSRWWPRLLVLSAAFLALLFFNINVFRNLSIRFLNETFWNRLEPNLNLDFLVWPLLIGTFFVLIDYYLDHKRLKKKVGGSLERWFAGLRFPTFSFVMILFLVVALLAPDFIRSRNIFSSKQLNQFVEPQDATSQAIKFQNFGGKETVDFLRTLPSKSVILADRFTIIPLATLVDDYMADYADGEFLNDYQKIYTPMPLDEKKAILAKAQVDYVLVMPGQKDGGIDQQPGVFRKIFDNGARVFEVNY
jgi:hypothetical protein